MLCRGLVGGIGSDTPSFSFPFPVNNCNNFPASPVSADFCSPLSFKPFSAGAPTAVRARLPSSGKTRATINDEFLSETEADDLSFYELLGISESGTSVEIKQAYKSLARKYHPDVSPPGRVKEYTRRFILVQEAYETLSDPHRRALYDRDLAMGLHFAFSARKIYHRDEETEGRRKWRNRWEDQLSELKRRSVNKEAGGNMSWGAKMRMQRKQAAAEAEAEAESAEQV